MNPFDILPADVMWPILSPSPSHSIREYVVWFNHYLIPFSLTSKSNHEKLNAYIESDAFKTALHPRIRNLDGPGDNSLTWNKCVKMFAIASDWLFTPLEITDKKEIPQGSSCFQIARINPDTQQWELMGVNIQRDSIYHIFEDEKAIYYNLKTNLDNYGGTWRRPLFNIASSQNYVAVVNGSFSVVVYDCKSGKQYSLDLQEIVLQLEIRNLELYIRTIPQDEKSQTLWIYALEKLGGAIPEPKKHLLPVDVNQSYVYKDCLVVLTSNTENLRSLPLANLKTTGIENEWISLPLKRNGRGIGICLSEMGIFTVLTEADKLKICCIQVDNRGFSKQEKSITLGEEFHNFAIYDVVYHLDRLIIRTGNFKILVVDYFSDSIIQTFKDFAGSTIVRHEDSFIHQMRASASKIYLFLLYKMRLPDGSSKFSTYIHTLQPKKVDEKIG